MPVLVDRNSVHLVLDVTRGGMTILWCQPCVELAGEEYVPYVSYAIQSGLRLRHTFRN